MNKIRTTALSAALAGGSILGLAGVTGIADAATNTDATPQEVDAVAQPSGFSDVGDDDERAERRAARQAAREANRQEIADVLGLSVEELAEQLSDGATLADVAEANGVDVANVVDVIVENMTERINDAVENERITAEVAAEKIAGLEEHVQTRVEEGRPDRGDGEGRHARAHHRAHHAQIAAEMADAEAES